MTNETNLKEEFNYKQTINLPQTDFPMRGDGPRREPEIQKFWDENKIYEKVLLDRKNNNIGRFLLHDGPPYLSSGKIHIGTALNKILKDIVVKYKTICGYYSPYLPGFDCHGLPIENAVLEKQKSFREEITPLELRKRCAGFASNNKIEQEKKFKRLGVLGDWEHSYMTMDHQFEREELKLFGIMVQKGYIYRGLKPVYWCSQCQTALAEAEIEYVENFKSPSIYISFDVVKLSNASLKLQKYNNLKIIVWTTTPWTIPGNVAISLNPDFDYVVARSIKYGFFIIAERLLTSFNKTINESCEIIDKLKGLDLEYTVCQHPLYKRESLVVLGHHVTLETGTGCVHTAPGHGLEDYEISQKYNLEILSPVDNKGHFTSEAGEDLKGLFVHKAGNQKVIEKLLTCGALVKQEDYFHSYPHCWRSNTPIIFRATKQWFCSVEKFKTQALKEIDNVKWIPEIGRNRIYSMVESRFDWCISRQRVWGMPIPAFYCASCSEVHLNNKIIENLYPMFSEYGSNVWWEKEAHELLPQGYKCICGSTTFVKEKDTLDVWFDSGVTHLSVVDKNVELGGSPSEMYLEGSDQHRGWFQSSLLTSIAMNSKAPYKSVLTHGFVLDETGRKMSKSHGNVIDPDKVVNHLGADLLRLWASSVDYSSDMRIGEHMLQQLSEVYRNIRNTSRFLLGNLFDFNLKSNYVQYDKLLKIDRYLLHKLEVLKSNVTECFNSYEFYKYYQLVQNFCAVQLSSFYFDLVKDRLYTSGKNSIQRRSAQTVLHEILQVLVRILIPVLPHLAEDIWKYIPDMIKSSEESVLYLKWPALNSLYRNEDLNKEFESILFIKDLVYKALEIARANKKIGKSVEAKIILYPKSDEIYELLKKYENELPTIYIVSQVAICNVNSTHDKTSTIEYSTIDQEQCCIVVTKASGEKCPRCWKYSVSVGKNQIHPTICESCVNAVEGLD